MCPCLGSYGRFLQYPWLCVPSLVPELTGQTDKRAHIRQPLNLAVRVFSTHAAAKQCRIKNFCLGGLFLDHDGREDGLRELRLQTDDIVNVQFVALKGNRNQEFRMRVRVAGVFQSGIGVEFIDPDPAALVTLQDLASRAASQARQAGPARNLVPGSDRARALDACRHAYEHFLKGSTKALFEQSDNDLFIAARDASSDNEQAQVLDAQKEIQGLAQSIEKDFVEQAMGKLKALGAPRTSESADQADEVSFDGMSLVDSHEFLDMLTVKRIIEKSEDRFRDDEFALLARLSFVAGKPVEKENNPVGLIEICGAFQSTMQHMGAGGRARKAIFGSFEKTVVRDLGSLYGEMTRCFLDNGILPNFKKPKPIVGRRHGAPPESDIAPVEQGVESEPSDGISAEVPSQPIAASPGSPALRRRYDERGSGAQGEPRRRSSDLVDQRGAVAPIPGPDDDVVAGAMRASAPPIPEPVNSDWSTGHSAGTPGNALRTARNLIDLNRRTPHRPAFSGAPAQSHRTNLSPPVVGSPAQAYEMDELKQALVALQVEIAAAAQHGSHRADVKSHVLRKLAETDDEGVAKKLAAPESDAIDIVTSLVTSILDDMLVADGMKPHIAKLEAPLVQVALDDEGFLGDRRHPARQFVDQLGRVNLPKPMKPGSKEERLSEDVDRLVRRILTEYDGDVGVFTEALTDVDELVERQANAYANNLEQVIDGCAKEKLAFAGMRRGGPQKTPKRKSRMGGKQSEEWKTWLQRAARLKAGDVLSINYPDGPRRETLAWVDEDKEKFVFVDSSGQKTSSMITQELAMQLRRGEAKLISNANLPAVDRGFHHIFQGLQERLSHDASCDALTGLLNRKQFEKRFELLLAQTRAEHEHHVLCHLDLDGFSNINRTCGRKASDELLRHYAKVLDKRFGARGLLGRLDADAFAIVIKDCALHEGRQAVDRHRLSFERSRVMWKGTPLPLSVSIGVSEVNDTTDDVVVALNNCRELCARAKEAGGNRTYPAGAQASPASAPKPAADEKEPGEILTEMMASDSIRLFCQRVAPLGGDADVKPFFEILLRIKGDQGTFAPPAPILRAAERSGRRSELDRWLISRVLHWIAANKRRMLKFGGLSMSLSNQTVNDPDSIGFVINEFTESKVPPGKIVFQITESAAVDELSAARDFIRVLNGYGCRFGLDDFGSETSSYAYLKELPIDHVRISGMFVKDITQNESDAAVVKSINEIGHFMEKKTVAESVDDEDTLARVRDFGVDYAQGVVFTNPVPLDDIN